MYSASNKSLLVLNVPQIMVTSLCISVTFRFEVCMFYEVDTETLNTHQSWISFFFQNVFFKIQSNHHPPQNKKKNKKTLSWVNDILKHYPGLYFSILKNQIFLVLWNIFCNDDTVRVWKFSRKSSHLEKSLEKIKGTFYFSFLGIFN